MNLKEYYKDKLNTKLNENIQEGVVGELLKGAGRAIWNQAKKIPSLIATQVQKKLSTGDYSALGILKQIQQHQYRKLSSDPGARRSGYRYTYEIDPKTGNKTGNIKRSKIVRGIADPSDRRNPDASIK